MCVDFRLAAAVLLRHFAQTGRQSRAATNAALLYYYRNLYGYFRIHLYVYVVGAYRADGVLEDNLFFFLLSYYVLVFSIHDSYYISTIHIFHLQMLLL